MALCAQYHRRLYTTNLHLGCSERRPRRHAQDSFLVVRSADTHSLTISGCYGQREQRLYACAGANKC